MQLGLTLNDQKCEIISDSVPQSLPSAVVNFNFTHSNDATLFGSPLLRGAATQKLLGNRVESLRVAAIKTDMATSARRPHHPQTHFEPPVPASYFEKLTLC